MACTWWTFYASLNFYWYLKIILHWWTCACKWKDKTEDWRKEKIADKENTKIFMEIKDIWFSIKKTGGVEK